MFNFFKKTSEKEKLQKQYAKMMEESYRISTHNRKAADMLQSEADELLRRIEQMN